MLKIKLHRIDLHRNECLFRPFVMNRRLFMDIGIRFYSDGNDYDLIWIGDKSFANKSGNLYDDAVQIGIRSLKKIGGDKILFDGQDSASMIGTYEVFKQSNAKLLLKNTLYTNLDDYSKASVYGRTFWGSDDENPDMNYKIDNLDMTNIILSGTNWLSTTNPIWYDYKNIKKDIDVCALFQYPAKDNWEFSKKTNQYYDNFRSKCINWINRLPSNVKVATLIDGEKYPIETYYNLMMRSKIVIAPFGYGEIAPRDIESAQLGSILIKNDMSHINTIPNIYSDETYCSVKWDFSDLLEKIDHLLTNYAELRDYYVQNMRNAFLEAYDPQKLVEYTYNWISQLDGYGTD